MKVSKAQCYLFFLIKSISASKSSRKSQNYIKKLLKGVKSHMS